MATKAWFTIMPSGLEVVRSHGCKIELDANWLVIVTYFLFPAVALRHRFHDCRGMLHLRRISMTINNTWWQTSADRWTCSFTLGWHGSSHLRSGEPAYAHHTFEGREYMETMWKESSQGPTYCHAIQQSSLGRIGTTMTHVGEFNGTSPDLWAQQCINIVSNGSIWMRWRARPNL